MKHVCLLYLGLGLLLAGCDKPASQAKPGENPLNAPADYAGAVLKGQQAAKKTIGAASLDQAIKNFYAEENRYPNSLDELVSKGTLPNLPTLPAGMMFDYDPATGTVKVVPKK